MIWSPPEPWSWFLCRSAESPLTLWGRDVIVLGVNLGACISLPDLMAILTCKRETLMLASAVLADIYRRTILFPSCGDTKSCGGLCYIVILWFHLNICMYIYRRFITDIIICTIKCDPVELAIIFYQHFNYIGWPYIKLKKLVLESPHEENPSL